MFENVMSFSFFLPNFKENSSNAKKITISGYALNFLTHHVTFCFNCMCKKEEIQSDSFVTFFHFNRDVKLHTS